MSLQQEVEDALSSCSIHDADSFVVVSPSNELRMVFDSYRNFAKRWNVISEIERQIGGFYVHERTSDGDGFIWHLTFRKHLTLLASEDK